MHRAARPLYEGLWIAGLLIGTLVVWQLDVVGSAGERLQFRATDLFLYFLPSYVYEAARLRAGALPLWSPYQGAGVPFVATLQPGALYPARLLLLFLDVPTAMHWSAVGHVLVTALATYGCCRRVGASPAGAVAGATTMVTVVSFTHVFWPSYLEPATWLPVAALAFLRVAEGGGWGWVLLLGVAGAMPALAGGYQLTLYIPYGLALFGLAVMLDARRRGTLLTPGGLGRLGLALLLALGTAAPQLLTTLAWTAETMRRAGPLSNLQIDPTFRGS